MFCKNLKNLRKAKGLSQEELAQRLHVVRQTISKWEKGLSVPDAILLIQIADILDTSVSQLLGDTITPPEEQNIIAQKLEQLNLQIAEKNKRSRCIWRVVIGILIGITVFTILCILLSMISYYSFVSPSTGISQEIQQLHFLTKIL